MSAHTKKHPTKKTAEVFWQGGRYSIPLPVLKKYEVKEKEPVFTVDEVFKDLIEEYTRPALILQGLRHREGLTQVEFAKIINVTQANLSAMENGKRPIGKEMAKRIAKKFPIDYRRFL